MRVWRPVLLVLTVLLGCSLASAQQTRQRSSTSTKPKQTEPQRPDPQQLASAAVDKFLRGVKLSDLSEGKAMLAETQWITGEADYGANFYSRPMYTDARTLFEGMFDTDVAGVRGYKRLVEMDAVSQAKTSLKIRFIAIAYPDKTSGQWKVLGTGTDDSADIEKNLTYFEQNLADTRYTSEQDNYLSYGYWLLKAGRIKDARQALLRARNANPFSASDPGGRIGGKYVPLHKSQIDALLEVIARVAGA